MKNWKKLFRNNLCLILLVGTILVFFYPTILQGKIPTPADTILGMYHPWRDKVWDGITTGVPYKNFLITDPVRQQYVWRSLAISEIKEGNLPLWNPYSFSGYPLLANFQSASFYPLNFLFFVFPFNLAWTILVVLQPLLGSIFLYLFLRQLGISPGASFLGGFTFAFSGFSIAWLEWNTVGHVILWLPLTLLAVEKIIQGGRTSNEVRPHKKLIWSAIFIFSLASSFFAGHLQIFFYSFLIINIYLAIKLISLKKDKLKIILLFVICYLLFVGATSVQWLPTLQFIQQSARAFDQGSWMKEGWFIPWQNLVQFLVPDFFGNPATGNYWGVWNYGEFIGYIGIAPLIFAFYALFSRRDKKTLFFAGLVILSLVFALPTPLAKLPYQLNLPFIATSQPTRLIFLTDFALAILAAFGLDNFLRQNSSKAQMNKLLAGIGIIFGIIWFFILFAHNFGISITAENILITRKNLILPSLLLVSVATLLTVYRICRKNNYYLFIVYCLLFIAGFDLFRFGWKFTPFTKAEWLFPETKILDTISQDKDQYRVMAVDRRIMPPNFAVSYGFNDVSGYDPLYLKSYSQLAGAWDRNKADLSSASFNRIITPSNYESFMTDLLGVKYIVSLAPLKSEKLEYVSTEGETYLYNNKEVFPRAFLVTDAVKVKSNQEAIDMMFSLGKNLRNTAVVEENIDFAKIPLQAGETAAITYYSPNYIVLTGDATADRLLVLSDIYYPGWKVFVDGKESRIYNVDFALRGIVVPPGRHKIEFKMNLI